jgi:drug/metabolite transporter (DMT)-like permease
MASPSLAGKTNQTRILVCFACVYLFWGSTYLAMRYGVEVLPPFVLGATRFLISGPLLLGICLVRGVSIKPTSRREFWMLAAIGTLMLVGGNTSVIWAEQILPSGLAALIVAAIPIYAALIEVIRPHGEGLRPQGWIGIAIGFAGLILLLWPGLLVGFHGDTRQIVSSAVLLFGALSWTIASILSRHTKIAISGMAAAGWEMLIAGLIDLAILGGTRQWHGTRWGIQAWASILWLVIVGSLITYTAYLYLLDHVEVSKVATYAYVNPIIAVALGAIFLHERFIPVEWLGMAAILVAVFLVNSSKTRRAPSSAAVAEDITALPAEQS